MVGGYLFISLLTGFSCLPAKADVTDYNSGSQYACRLPGWKLLGDKCYLVDAQLRTRDEAEQFCNGSLAAMYSNGLSGIIGSESWLKYFGSQWTMDMIEQYGTGVFEANMNAADRWRKSYSTEFLCTTMLTNGTMRVTNCTDKMSSVCQSKPDCGQYHWGDGRCDKLCYCSSGECTRRRGYCINRLTGEYSNRKFMCRTGWTGLACSTPQDDITAEFYCFSNPKSVQLNIDLNGIIPVSVIRPLTPVALGNCNINNPGGLAKIFTSIEMIDGMFSPDCAATQIDENTYRWDFVVRQTAQIVSAYDINFSFECNFTHASDLDLVVSSPNVSLIYPKKAQTIVPQSEVPMEIFLQDLNSDGKLVNVSFGKPVTLELRYTTNITNLVTRFSPRRCVAKSPDGRMVKLLTDDRGCSSANNFNEFQLTPLGYSSNIFAAFYFPNSSMIVFRCDLIPIYSHSDSRLQTCIAGEDEGGPDDRIGISSNIIHVRD